MKRVLAWFAGLLGIAALGRWLATRTHRQVEEPTPVEETPSAEPAPDDPVAELRRKLAESREADAEEPVAAAREETLDERRARVHAQARAVIDAMSEDAQG